MHSSGSILYTTISRIRSFLDEPTLDAKYTNDYLIRHVITPEISNVMSMIIEARKTPIVVRHQISLTASAEYYELPPSVGKIYRIAKIDSDKVITNEIPARGPDSSEDAGWWVEGRELHVRPLPSGTNNDYYIWYTPTGNVIPHYSADGGSISWSTRNTLTLDTTPDLGDVDHRENAYIGCVVRAWVNDAGQPDKVDERVIEASTITTSNITAEVRSNFTTGSWSGVQANVKYEIVPYFMDEIWQAVALSSAINLGTSKNISEKQMAFLQGQLQAALQSAASSFDPVSNETVNHPNNSLLHDMVSKIRWKLPKDVQDEYSDDYIMNVAMIPEVEKVLTVANNDIDTAIILTQDLTEVDDKSHYLLNPNVGRIIRVAKKDATFGLSYQEIRKRDEKDPDGHGWSIQGNRLSFAPHTIVGDGDTPGTITVWYTPNGSCSPHFAVDGSLTDDTNMKLSKGDIFSGLLGEIDRRSSSYVGSTIRLITSTGTVEERVITAHNAADSSGYQGTVTVTEPFTGTTGGRACTYEIVPAWWVNLESVVVDASVLALSSKSKELGESGFAILGQTYQSSMSALQAELAVRNEERFSTSRKYSMLHNILEKTQTTLSKLDPNLNYSSDYIVRHGIFNELNNVISRLNNTRSNPYYSSFTITTVKDQQYYALPAGISEIVRIVELDSSGRIIKDLLPRGNYSWSGPGWSIENNMISFRPYPSTAQEYTIWYISSGDVSPHYAEDGYLWAGHAKITLSSGGWGSGLLGQIDQRDSAYVGHTVRLLSKAANPFGNSFESQSIQERTIKGVSTTGSNVYELDRPFTNFDVDTAQTVIYEIVPMYLNAISEAVSAGAAANLSMGSPTMTQRQQKTLYTNYRSAMKTAGDNLSNLQGRIPKHFHKSTVDNEGNWDILG